MLNKFIFLLFFSISLHPTTPPESPLSAVISDNFFAESSNNWLNVLDQPDLKQLAIEKKIDSNDLVNVLFHQYLSNCDPEAASEEDFSSFKEIASEKLKLNINPNIRKCFDNSSQAYAHF